METTTIISNIATAVSAVVAAVALLLTFLKYREKTKTDHANRMADLLERTRKDPNITNFFNKIDLSDNGWYSKSFYENGFEQTADNALLQFEHILYLKEKKLLTEEEFSQYQYEIDKIVNDQDVQRYFFNLYHYCKRVALSFKYDKLLKYGTEKGAINSDFHDKNSKNYGDKVLIF